MRPVSCSSVVASAGPRTEGGGRARPNLRRSPRPPSPSGRRGRGAHTGARSVCRPGPVPLLPGPGLLEPPRRRPIGARTGDGHVRKIRPARLGARSGEDARARGASRIGPGPRRGGEGGRAAPLQHRPLPARARGAQRSRWEAGARGAALGSATALVARAVSRARPDQRPGRDGRRAARLPGGGAGAPLRRSRLRVLRVGGSSGPGQAAVAHRAGRREDPGTAPRRSVGAMVGSRIARRKGACPGSHPRCHHPGERGRPHRGGGDRVVHPPHHPCPPGPRPDPSQDSGNAGGGGAHGLARPRAGGARAAARFPPGTGGPGATRLVARLHDGELPPPDLFGDPGAEAGTGPAGS